MKTPIEIINQTNKIWINIDKDSRRWSLQEENLHNDRVRTTEVNTRQNNQSRPASYFGGVRPSDEETAHIT